MNELITRLTNKAGISAEQAAKTIETIREFAKEKFPMMSGAIDNILSGNEAAGTASATVAFSSIIDKISDVIPGETGKKVAYLFDAA